MTGLVGCSIQRALVIADPGADMDTHEPRVSGGGWRLKRAAVSSASPGVRSQGNIMRPQNGDILVSKDVARVEHEVSIVPEATASVCPNHDSAVKQAQALAKERRVDAWLTEDHIHFMRIASHRTA